VNETPNGVKGCQVSPRQSRLVTFAPKRFKGAVNGIIYLFSSACCTRGVVGHPVYRQREAMSKKSAVLSKSDVLELLSQQLRRTDLEGGTLVKLTSLYARIAGWRVDQRLDRFIAEDKEPTMDEMVTALERERKQKKQI